METMTFRTILEEEFSFRVNENSSYSIRAFARDIGISPSQLSEVLSGKVGLSSKKAVVVAQNLGLSDKEVTLFKALVEFEHGRSEKIKNEAKDIIDSYEHSSKYKGLSLDGFKLISDWYYFAILSTMELDRYDGSTLFIANHLNLDIEIIEDAIKRLLKLDIIDISNGKFIPTGEMFSTSHDIASSALKKFHKQHIRKSLDSIDNVPVDKRDITTMTMAIDIDKLPQAKKLITKFRRDLCKFMESDKKNNVYNLNIQLIPLAELDT
ncbi:MAG: TIGR02147 family protein [Bacteriovoracaceae bacterium]|jgi:uncharacterized protein (TIGR02147 family)|nr:TIGR02147 family protein [Bacteriovoracaceae bacterium]